MEKANFHSRSDQNLYYITYKPETDSESVVIICDSFVEERLWSQRVLVNVARTLMQNNILTVRFDYYGCGESDGDHNEVTIKSMVKDTMDIVNFISSKYSPKNIYLLGLRLGANIALHSASNLNKKLKGLILIEPLLDLSSILNEKMRSLLTIQMTAFKKIVKKRSQMEEDLKNGAQLDLEGYLINPELFDDFKSMSFIPQKKEIENLKKLIINYTQIDKAKIKDNSKFGNNDSLIIKSKKYWIEQKLYLNKCSNTEKTVVEWLLDNKNKEQIR